MPLNFDPIEEARRNWQQNGWGDGHAMVAATSITRAHQIVVAETNAALAPFGLTFSRFEVLALLFFSQQRALPMGKIGARLQVHPTSVTSLVDRLADDGLVERRPHPTDRRTTLVALTDEGAALAPKCAAALEASAFGLGGVDRRDLDEISARISALREAEGDWSKPSGSSHA